MTGVPLARTAFAIRAVDMQISSADGFAPHWKASFQRTRFV